MKPAHRVAIAAVLGLMLAGCAGTLSAQAARLEVRSVRWQGNERFPDRVLAAAIITRETTCRSWILEPLCYVGVNPAHVRRYLDAREFSRDLVRLDLFYYLRGYREATVDTLVQRSTDGVDITFRITEGEPVIVADLTIVDPDSVLGGAPVRNLPLEQGQAFNTAALEASRDSLVQRMRRDGYFHADVLTNYLIPGDTPHVARVTLETIPGPRTYIGAITIEGAQAVEETVVRRMLPFRGGDLYRADQIFQGQRNLYNLQIFSHASIEPMPASPFDSIIPLVVRVNESAVHRIRAGAGMSTADCLNAETRWSSRNFMGGARILQVRGRVSNVMADPLGESLCNQSGSGIYGRLNWVASAEFTQPWLFSPKNSFSLAPFAEHQSLPDVFVRRAVGATAAISRIVGRSSVLTLAYRPQLAELDAAEIFFCTSFQVCASRDIARLQSASWLSPLGLSLSRDRTNQVFAPTAGYTLIVDLEHASALTGSDYPYNRIVADYARFDELAPGWIVATRLRPGALVPRPFVGLSPLAGDVEVVHPQKRFYAGGPNSMRGFALNQLGPRVLTVDAVRLVSGGDGARCTPEEIETLVCDPNPFPQSMFVARPIGGSALLEGSMELRFPVYRSILRAAAFVDFGQVWASAGDSRFGEIEVAPGFGLRYFTPIGPIRVDVAYRSANPQSLPVVTTKLIPLGPCPETVPGGTVATPDGTCWTRSNELAPLELPKLWHESQSFFNRLQLHFAIGQAF